MSVHYRIQLTKLNDSEIHLLSDHHCSFYRQYDKIWVQHPITGRGVLPERIDVISDRQLEEDGVVNILDPAWKKY